MNEDTVVGALFVIAMIGVGSFVVAYQLFFKGLFIVEPREAIILLYWGKYSRTINTPGIHLAFPIGLGWKRISTRDQAIALPVTTVVEGHGNPIQVSAICVYRIVDAARATIDVQGYQGFVASQASVVLKSVCSHYPYEGRGGEPCLKDDSPELLRELTTALQKNVEQAGVQVVLVRINDLTYAPEIAQSMLLRQQAKAMVDARRTIVEGAVATVADGLDQLAKAGLPLSPRTRASLAANLTLLLCAGERGESHSTVVSRHRT